MDRSYTSQLSVGVEKKYRELENRIIEDRNDYLYGGLAVEQIPNPWKQHG